MSFINISYNLHNLTHLNYNFLIILTIVMEVIRQHIVFNFKVLEMCLY